jgi:hypothetical protein
MLAAILGMTRNLQLAQRLRAPSGRTHKRISRRVYILPRDRRLAMLRKLDRRERDLAKIEQAIQSERARGLPRPTRPPDLP